MTKPEIIRIYDAENEQDRKDAEALIGCLVGLASSKKITNWRKRVSFFYRCQETKHYNLFLCENKKLYRYIAEFSNSRPKNYANKRFATAACDCCKNVIDEYRFDGRGFIEPKETFAYCMKCYKAQLNLKNVAKAQVLEEAQEKQDSIYKERNNLAIAFAKMALACGFDAGIGRDEDDKKGWDKEWLNVVYVELPSGEQVSWHMRDIDAKVAKEILPKYTKRWDGTSIGQEGRWPLRLHNIQPKFYCAVNIDEVPDDAIDKKWEYSFNGAMWFEKTFYKVVKADGQDFFLVKEDMNEYTFMRPVQPKPVRRMSVEEATFELKEAWENGLNVFYDVHKKRFREMGIWTDIEGAQVTLSEKLNCEVVIDE